MATLALAWVAAALGACGGQGSGDPGQVARTSYGINGVVLRAWLTQGRDPLVERQLASIDRLGIDFIRAQLGWQQLEPAPPTAAGRQYEFADADRWVTALARHHLRWYVFGVGIPTPEWARIPGLAPSCSFHSPPADPLDYAAVMSAVARRYGAGGTFWTEHPELPAMPVRDYEVWNAPNFGGSWCPAPDADAYAELYEVTSRAIHAVDADADVVVGGLGTFPQTSVTSSGLQQTEPTEFLEQMLDARPGLETQLDVVGAHVYAPDGQAALATIAALRGRLDSMGLQSVPISWNEVGWPTRGAGGEGTVVSDGERAGDLQTVASANLAGCGVSSVAPHTWVTVQQDPANPEDWFGIADPATGRPYPSALAYAAGIRAGRSGDYSSAPCD